MRQASDILTNMGMHNNGVLQTSSILVQCTHNKQTMHFYETTRKQPPALLKPTIIACVYAMNPFAPFLLLL
jgi:hypothetical protein